MFIYVTTWAYFDIFICLFYQSLMNLWRLFELYFKCMNFYKTQVEVSFIVLLWYQKRKPPLLIQSVSLGAVIESLLLESLMIASADKNSWMIHFCNSGGLQSYTMHLLTSLGKITFPRLINMRLISLPPISSCVRFLYFYWYG